MGNFFNDQAYKICVVVLEVVRFWNQICAV